MVILKPVTKEAMSTVRNEPGSETPWSLEGRTHLWVNKRATVASSSKAAAAIIFEMQVDY